MRIPLMQVLAALVVSGVLSGCSESKMGEVSLQLATRRPTMMSAGAQASVVTAAGQLTVSLGPDGSAYVGTLGGLVLLRDR